jgi:aspartate/methionine/tyrosine aminotransferase
MHYLRWAKLHTPARYELTPSGVPPVRLHDIRAESLSISLEHNTAYGDPDLIEAIAKLYDVAAAEVVVVPGASSANFIALAAAAKHGECVMVEQPTYDPFEHVSRFLGFDIIPIERRASQGFGIGLDEIEAGLRRGARALMLSNLHNPSGQLLTSETIEQIAALCARANATVIVDEAYLDGVCLTGHGPRWTAATLADNVVSTSSLTKVYGLGGLRIGWLIANPEFAERGRYIMDLLSVVNAVPAMSLALCALSKLQDLEERYQRFYEEGQVVYRRWLAGEHLVRGYENLGAMFECVRLSDGISADRFNELLVTEYDTQVVPGRFFGLDDHIRLSIALPAADLTEALSRVSEALRRLLDRPG